MIISQDTQQTLPGKPCTSHLLWRVFRIQISACRNNASWWWGSFRAL